MTTIGKMTGVIGPPGTGKSELIARAEEWARKNKKRIAVACVPFGEKESYPENDIFVVKTFDDIGWAPLTNDFKADAYMALYKWLGNLRQVDDIGLVAVDTFSEVTHLAMHDVLSTYSTGDPSEPGHGAAYIGHNRRIMDLKQQLERLTLAGKHVVCTFHGEMREMAGKGKAEEKVTMKSQNRGDKVLTWDDQYVPAMLSAIREKIPGWFSLWLFASCAGVGTGAKYTVSSLPVEGVPAKRRKNMQLTLKPPMTEAAMPNDFSFLMEALGL